MAQITFEDLVNGTVPDASDFNSRFNALKNRINNGVEADNIADSAISTAKLANDAVNALKLDETDDYTWTGAQDFSGATITGISANSPTGSYTNLVISRPSVETVDVNIDELIVTNGTDNISLSSVDLTADITASGANGLDTGSEANVWYYIWVIYNGTTTASLLSVSSTLGTIILPSGYTYGALVGAVHNTSGDFVDFIQKGDTCFYSSWISIASGNVGGGSWTSIDVTTYVPSAISDLSFGVIGSSTDSHSTKITNDSSATATADAVGANIILSRGSNTSSTMWKFNLLTANTLYWQGAQAGNTVWLAGFTINKGVS